MASFRKLKSGRWQARIWKDGKYESIGTFRTKKEAELAAGKAEEKVYYAYALNDRKKLFKDLADEWLNLHKKNNLKDSTFEQYEVVVRLHILPFFGRKKVSRIRRSDIQKWMNHYFEMVDDDGNEVYSYGSRLRYLSVLKSIFHYAVHELEILEKDPSNKLKIPIKDKVKIKKDLKYYSLDELNKLLNFMETYQHQRFKDYRLYYTLMYFLSQTGLRISEALLRLNGQTLTVKSLMLKGRPVGMTTTD